MLGDWLQSSYSWPQHYFSAQSGREKLLSSGDSSQQKLVTVELQSVLLQEVYTSDRFQAEPTSRASLGKEVGGGCGLPLFYFSSGFFGWLQCYGGMFSSTFLSSFQGLVHIMESRWGRLFTQCHEGQAQSGSRCEGLERRCWLLVKSNPYQEQIRGTWGVASGQRRPGDGSGLTGTASGLCKAHVLTASPHPPTGLLLCGKAHSLELSRTLLKVPKHTLPSSFWGFSLLLFLSNPALFSCTQTVMASWNQSWSNQNTSPSPSLATVRASPLKSSPRKQKFLFHMKTFRTHMFSHVYVVYIVQLNASCT